MCGKICVLNLYHLILVIILVISYFTLIFAYGTALFFIKHLVCLNIIFMYVGILRRDNDRKSTIYPHTTDKLCS